MLYRILLVTESERAAELFLQVCGKLDCTGFAILIKDPRVQLERLLAHDALLVDLPAMQDTIKVEKIQAFMTRQNIHGREPMWTIHNETMSDRDKRAWWSFVSNNLMVAPAPRGVERQFRGFNLIETLEHWEEIVKKILSKIEPLSTQEELEPQPDLEPARNMVVA